jgi:FtsP/CotA-like multicopper oxidase with cupredoxin domain
VKPERLSRRDWLKLGAAGVAGVSGATVLDLASRGGAAAALAASGAMPPEPGTDGATPGPHAARQEGMGIVGMPGRDGVFDPAAFLADFDYGEVTTRADGRVVRRWEMVALDRDIEIAPGVFFPAWTYNGQVPGPTLRCTEGDILQVEFVNAGSHPHTIHFHGTHPPEMDGFEPIVEPGQRFTYEFEAKPFGLHLYHCHTMPLKRHIHKGLYGTFIVDPPEGREPAREMVMVMNAFDSNLDGDNEVYAVNTSAFYYRHHPVRVGVGDLCRIYLVNTTEFDLINSFHLHAGMFKVFRTGTRPDQYELTDTIMMCQGERHLLEFRLENPGMHMFHAHQSEFAELGWMGFFEAVERLAADDGVPVRDRGGHGGHV